MNEREILYLKVRMFFQFEIELNENGEGTRRSVRVGRKVRRSELWFDGLK